MSIKLLEHIRDELRGSGAIQNTPEFCTSWLGRSEGYIRTLRFHGLEPSVEALSVCSHKLGHYADKLRGSDLVLTRLRSGLPTHLCSPSFKGQGAFSTQ